MGGGGCSLLVRKEEKVGLDDTDVVAHIIRYLIGMYSNYTKNLGVSTMTSTMTIHEEIIPPRLCMCIYVLYRFERQTGQKRNVIYTCKKKNF